MRVLASIITLVLLYLSVQPAFDLLEKMQKTGCCSGCCQTEGDTSKEEQNTNNSCNGICNPFQSCSSCCGYVLEFIHFQISEPISFINKEIIHTEYKYSQFSPDFWQPPKIT